MTEATNRTNTTRRRQHLVLAGIVTAIAGITAASVWLTADNNRNKTAQKPVTTHILTPGAQVDPKDAWRGQADAQLKAIEQKSRELGDRHTELTTRSTDMLERLKRLEQAGLTPIPPAPIPGPVIKPDFGPDRPTAARDPLLQRLPPPPPPSPGTLSPASPAVSGTGQPLHPNSIVSITLADAPTMTPNSKSTGARTPNGPTPIAKDTRRYLPSGSFTRALLLGGLDAPTGGQVQRNPQPVLLKLLDNAVLPNHFRSKVKECFVVGAGYGDVSAERAYIRTESLSCITTEGNAIDVPLKGYVAGEDGKAGMRGRLVTKQGQLLANALIAGVAGGIGQAFRQSATTMSVSPLGSTSTVDPERQLQAGLGSGVGKAMDRLAQYYISLAEKVFPVIEVDAGRTVDVVITQGLAFGDTLDSGPQDSDDEPTETSAPSARATTRQDEDPDDD